MLDDRAIAAGPKQYPKVSFPPAGAPAASPLPIGPQASTPEPRCASAGLVRRSMRGGGAVLAAPGSHLVATAEIAAGVQTIMVRNIPKKSTLATLLQVWPPDGSYDFLHIPYNARTHQHANYVFMNFVSTAHAQAFVRRWQGQPFPGAGGVAAGAEAAKPLTINAAFEQGLITNVIKHRKAVEQDEDHQPFICHGARRIDLKAFVEGLGIHSL